jgi:hypothetical protein
MFVEIFFVEGFELAVGNFGACRKTKDQSNEKNNDSAHQTHLTDDPVFEQKELAWNDNYTAFFCHGTQWLIQGRQRGAFSQGEFKVSAIVNRNSVLAGKGERPGGSVLVGFSVDHDRELRKKRDGLGHANGIKPFPSFGHPNGVGNFQSPVSRNPYSISFEQRALNRRGIGVGFIGEKPA